MFKIPVSLKKRVDDVSIYKKILISTIAMVIVFISIIGLVANNISSYAIREQAKYPIRDALDTTRSNIEIYLSYTFFTLNSIKDAIEMSEVFPVETYLTQAEALDKKDRLMAGISDALARSRNNISLEIQFASYILNGGSPLSEHASPFFYQTAVTSSERIQDEEWYAESKKINVKANEGFRNSSVRWHVKRVDSQNNNEYLIVTCSAGDGIVAVGLKMVEIEKFLSGSELILIIDERGRVVYSKRGSDFGADISKEEYVQNILAADKGQFTSRIEGKENLVTFSRLNTYSESNWKIVSLMPSDKLTANAVLVRNIIIATGLACILVAVLLSLLVARGITNPIRILASSMKKVKEGSLDITVERDSRDEIGELYGTFNKMIRDLNTLIEKIYMSERYSKEIEIKFLQSQINPHFLYNTLSTIKWMGIIHNIPTISQITTDLVKLLRNSIGKEGYMISVEGEIENLQSYIGIQQVRFNNTFRVNFDIEEEILEFHIFKLILQPVVENAINYAFTNRKDMGSIGIKGYHREDRLIFEVLDDGVGMDEKQIAGILEDTGLEEKAAKRDKFSGIGLKNIQDRIKLSYGDEYGLSIESKPGEGTKVVLVLPVIRNLDV